MIGQTISHYKVIEKLGEGGMGVVYKAQDTSLDRFVALKFLPAHLSGSEQDKARFIQEARAAAALNHPNICTIYGIEESAFAEASASGKPPADKSADKHDNQMFIAMEFVEGQTLRDVSVRRGDVSSPAQMGEGTSPLPLKQSVEIGIQLADGLSAAHEKGIVHRDIKPENIMIQKDGRVRIMDFGLAKLKSASRLTKAGSTVGTTGYMSPEQVQGMESDHRSDIFSLGVILYELFAGQSPFKGVHETAINYEIVNVDPQPMSSVKQDISPELDSIVLECLAKELSERTQSVAEVAKDLRHYKRESSKVRMSRVTTARPKMLRGSSTPELIGREQSSLPAKKEGLLSDNRFPWIASGLFFIGMAWFGVLYLLSLSAEKQVVRSFILPPEKENFSFYGNFGGPAVISPDGKRLAFAAADSVGKRFLFVRQLNSTIAHRLEGTAGVLFPFWSPDNQFIAFEAQGKLRKIDASGGAPITICDGTNFRGGTWNANGMIVLSPTPTDPLWVVSSTGGTLTPVTKLDVARKENSHRWPSFLPDGKHVLYFARTVAAGAQSEGGAICIASLDGSINKILIPASSNAILASGFLLYARGTNLVAQRFDEGKLELVGEAITIAEGISYDQSVTRGLFTASQNGILVYQTGNVQLGSRLTFYDRFGRATGTVGGLAEHVFTSLSPNGQRIAASIFDFQSHNNSLWIYEIARGLRSRFTFGAAYNQSPVWSPDGSRIIFSSNQGGIYNLYQKSSTGTGGEEMLLQTNEDKFPLDCSPDGRFLLYGSNGGSKSQGDLWVLPLGGDHKPVPFLQTEFNETIARFSPDGRWVAYTSNESGQYEVYIKTFQGTGSRWQVSISGGGSPRWRRDGKELYYINADNKLMAAEISLKETTVDVSNVHPLFEAASMAQVGDYGVTADGQRFLINTLNESQNHTPLTVVVNWDVELKKK